jgi:5'-nucleotidase
VGGEDSALYLAPFHSKLFLSANAGDVRAALKAGHAAAQVYPPPNAVQAQNDDKQVRIAFDGDAVLFSADSERVYQTEGLARFHQHESELENVPLEPGPFKGFLQALADIQQRFSESDCPIRTALVTARDAPAHKRAIKTLRNWNIRINKSFFLGGVEKTGVLEVFRPHIFFDDQAVHLKKCAGSVPSAEVICESEESAVIPPKKTVVSVPIGPLRTDVKS